MTRAEIVRAANAASAASRTAGAPCLYEGSSLGTLIEWLVWNDPNGCHRPEDQEAEGFAPYCLEAAWEAVRGMID